MATFAEPSICLRTFKKLRPTSPTTPASIDLGRVTFRGQDDQEQQRYFINVSSFGFSAAVANWATNAASKSSVAKSASWTQPSEHCSPTIRPRSRSPSTRNRRFGPSCY